MTPVTLRLATTPYGRIRVIDNWCNFKRLYVSRKTNLGTYVVFTEMPGSMDNMTAIDGEYHFRTLADLRAALERTHA